MSAFGGKADVTQSFAFARLRPGRLRQLFLLERNRRRHLRHRASPVTGSRCRDRRRQGVDSPHGHRVLPSIH